MIINPYVFTPPASVGADVNNPDIIFNAETTVISGGTASLEKTYPDLLNYLSVTRNSAASYIDSANNLLEAPTNNIRLDYAQGVPAIMFQNGGTNRAFPSEPTSTPAMAIDQNITYNTFSFDINNLESCVTFGDNSLERYLFYQYQNQTLLGTNHDSCSFIFFIQMDDNSLPVIGTDFNIVLNSINATSSRVIRMNNTNTYYCIGVTNNVVESTPNNFGIQKLVSHSSKSFKTTGFMLSCNPNSLSLTWYNSYIKTTTAAVQSGADFIYYLLGDYGNTEGSAYFNLIIDEAGNSRATIGSTVNSDYFGVYANVVRALHKDPQNTSNNYVVVTQQSINVKVVLTWDETGAYWYGDNKLKIFLNHDGLIPYTVLNRLNFTGGNPYWSNGGSSGIRAFKFWSSKLSEEDALSLTV